MLCLTHNIKDINYTEGYLNKKFLCFVHPFVYAVNREG